MQRLDINDSPIYDIFYNGDRISQVFYNGESIYRAGAYPPHTLLLNEAVAGTYEFHFKKGRYYIALTGAGAQTSGGYYYICGKNLGSSGGTVTGDFYVNEECDANIIVGANSGGKSYLVVDEVEMMTANGGNTCHSINDCGNHAGGLASFSLSGSLSDVNLKAIQGNNGWYTTGNTSTGVASNDPISTSRGQGGRAADCNVIAGNPGGVYIEYISG